MAGIRTISEINDILNPYLFQVVGSTPESIRDSIKNSALRNNPVVASRLAATCVFAAAVNKSTLENFIAKPEVADARPVIASTFSISGRSNMTGLTLLGHCLMTTRHVSAITFVVEFRRKMGQDHLWAGNLESGSLSEQQRKILKEKQRVTTADAARLLGSGFFKYTGIDPIAMSTDEATFWNEPIATTIPVSTPRPRPAATVASSSSRGSPPERPSSTLSAFITLSNGTVAEIPRDIVEYYRSAINPDNAKLVASVEKRGVAKFIDDYRRAMAEDPDRRGYSGSSVV